MRLSKDARKTALGLFRASLRDGVVDRQRVESVVRALTTERPRHCIQILREYQRRLRVELEKRRVVVETARKLGDKQRSQVTEELRSRHGADIEPEFEVDPELLGGLRVRVGSNVWDGTVRARLDRLARKL